MTTRWKRNENANAEILGVVILIGILAVTAGIISATSLSSPQPTKIPAASIEVTGSSGAIRIAHLGGDPLPSDSLVRGTKSDGTTETLTLDAWLGLSGKALSNGFSEVNNKDWVALILTWRGDSGESVIASWDPFGIYGPLGRPELNGSVPGVPYVPRTQPPVPKATTEWNTTLQGVVANFTPLNGTSVGAGAQLWFVDYSEGNITHWSWNFGNATTLEVTVPNSTFPLPYVYPNEGTYYATLTVTNNATGAHDTVTHAIQVGPPSSPSPLPLIDFTIEPRNTGNRILTITCLASVSSINATAWQWEWTDSQTGESKTIGPFFGDLMSDPSKSQIFEFLNHDDLSNNICTVTLTVWSPYLRDPVAVTKTVTVGPRMQASFNPNVTAGIVSLPVQFIDTSAGVIDTWSWNFGDGTTSDIQHPVHVYSAAGTYTVTLTVAGYDQLLGGIVTETSPSWIITAEDPVIANFTANVTSGELGGAGFPVAFTDLSTGDPTNWTWSFGDGVISHDKNPVHTYSQKGKWMVSLVAEKFDPDSADVMVKYIYIRVGPAVTANFTAEPTIIAAGLPVSFFDKSESADPAYPVNKWSWDFGDNTTDTTNNPNPQHIYQNPGNYSVTLEVENDYRINATPKAVYITVVPPVVASFIANQTKGPVPMIVQFSNQSSGNPTRWAWSFGDGGTSTDQNPVHNYTAKGTYSVELIASSDLSLSSDTLIRTSYIAVFEQVIANFTANKTRGQAPMTVQLTDNSTGDVDAWSWDFDSNGIVDSSIQNPLVTYHDPGNYVVNLTAWNQLRPDIVSTKLETIHVYDPPTASFTIDPASGPAPLLVTFTDTSTGTPLSWSWNFDDGSPVSGEQNPTHTYAAARAYNVTFRVEHPAGTSTATQTITVT